MCRKMDTFSNKTISIPFQTSMRRDRPPTPTDKEGDDHVKSDHLGLMLCRNCNSITLEDLARKQATSHSHTPQFDGDAGALLSLLSSAYDGARPLSGHFASLMWIPIIREWEKFEAEA
jgi:hypothetical protein